ncbi:hypothetical protein S2M10_11910 [Sphingomonas sp. S2M10]|uniref:hypothetical protein n=1 Tax=Sphingomonas sp. S2M10 TaxID=2705010 RepID=UPI001456997E|nr:hypothetical protein [Sphingomonas sp. S2M10]NLS26210.1 hypothetical protein [Sphingomonas sp. S2M10]
MDESEDLRTALVHLTQAVAELGTALFESTEATPLESATRLRAGFAEHLKLAAVALGAAGDNAHELAQTIESQPLPHRFVFGEGIN